MQASERYILSAQLRAAEALTVLSSDNQMTLGVAMKRMGCLVALFGLAACGPIPTMIMPDQLERTGDVYEVSGANGSFLPSLFTQHISFGPYVAGFKTSDEEDLTSPTILNGEKEIRESRQRAWFTMRGGSGGAWRGTCIRKDRTVIQHAYSLEIGNRGIRTEDHPVVTEDVHQEQCDLQGPDGSFSKVGLIVSETEVRGGSVRSHFGAWQLSASYEQRDQPFGYVTAGVVFRDQASTIIAALDTGGRKRVALKHALESPERDLVAAVSITVLLQRFL